MYEEVINLDEVVTAFVQSGAEARWKGEPVSDLFSFLLQYHFHREVDEKERTTFFCQIVSLYESQLEIRNEFGKKLHLSEKYAYRVFAAYNIASMVAALHTCAAPTRSP